MGEYKFLTAACIFLPPSLAVWQKNGSLVFAGVMKYNKIRWLWDDGKKKPDKNLRLAFETLLDIPNVEIEKVRVDINGDYVVTVKIAEKGKICRVCGKYIDKPYGYDRPIKLRHLPLMGRKVFIEIRPARYQCSDCDGNPKTTQKLSWYEWKSPHTRAYEKHILLLCVNSTVSDVSIKEDVGYEAIMGIINRHINKKVDWKTIEILEVIGLDEIS